MNTPLTILCIASYEKGHAFLRQCKQSGARVFLLTSLSLKDKAQWPTDVIDELFYMPDEDHVWNREHTLNAVAHLCRNHVIDRLVPLDDFDLELAAFLREHLRIPGMGETTTRYFRDKLAMRMKAREKGLNVPDFVPILNHQRVTEYLDRVPGPWVLKPRMLAGAIGIKKVHTAQEAWDKIHALGDQQSYYLLERFIPGDIFHVDSIVYENKLVYAVASEYGRPPLDVSQSGDIFTTRLMRRGSEREQAVRAKNVQVLSGLGLVRGVSHTEFIIAHEDGKVYFLETSARVGGAHIADLVEAATGINMWAEWAKVELAGGKAPYSPPEAKEDYAALLVSLAKQQWPDLAAYNDPEVVWRMNREHHAGLIVKSPDYDRITELLEQYRDRFREDFWAMLPARDKPTH
ncbi:MAG: ATP-grasp domain-containing protein [Acidobacteria bacterium]|nr:ATP-grasp domain-containing protein [Acidobacteriota bacterium]